MRAELVIIDPQNDFCDPTGALYVKGADEDMRRLAEHIDRVGDKYSAIHVTLDSHQSFHIAHPVFWIDQDGKHPDPFTIINEQDVKDGKWMTSITGQNNFIRQWGLNYVSQLAAQKRYLLCIWPEHCLIGSTGHAVYPTLFKSLQKWEARRPGRYVDYVTKGSNPLTEHYSAIRADVPVPNDPTTQMNTRFLSTIDQADIVGLAGEASSHCTANTGRDACNFFKDDRLAKKMTFIRDAASPVPGFEHLETDFVKEMLPRGMQESTCAEFLR